jgi:acetylornithine aminotransferase
LDDVDDWDRVALVWVNYPNNPTGATAPLAFYEELAERARAHDFVLCSDEAYSELWFDQPPRSALELDDRSNVAVFQTLSKRSSMTGYRSGFVAAPAEIVAALRTYRPSTGAAPQEFVQRASVVAWGDEEHVERARDAYRRKREVLLPVLERKGWRIAASEATMYLWVEVAGDETSEECAERLLRHGIVVAPGSYLGESGEGYIRIALVPTPAECERAAAILEEVL